MKEVTFNQILEMAKSWALSDEFKVDMEKSGNRRYWVMNDISRDDCYRAIGKKVEELIEERAYYNDYKLVRGSHKTWGEGNNKYRTVEIINTMDLKIVGTMNFDVICKRDNKGNYYIVDVISADRDSHRKPIDEIRRNSLDYEIDSKKDRYEYKKREFLELIDEMEVMREQINNGVTVESKNEYRFRNIVSDYNKALSDYDSLKNTVRCDSCYNYIKKKDLIKLSDNSEDKGCPCCKTDKYLVSLN